MSYIGKKIIKYSSNISVYINKFKYKSHNEVIVKGLLGSQVLVFDKAILINHNELNREIKLSVIKDSTRNKMLWGLYRTKLLSVFLGLSHGFYFNIEVRGRYLKYFLKLKELYLDLGFSHIIKYQIPKNIFMNLVEKNEKLIQLFGTNLSVLYSTGSFICSLKPVGPYINKGLCYETQIIRLKEGKKEKV